MFIVRIKHCLILLLLVHAMPSNAAVIFMYHRFGEADYPSTSVELEQFEEQLAFIEEEGFTVWPLPKVVRYLQEGKTVPDRTIVLTIDDAYESVYRHAFPLLAEHGMPFTVFVASDPVDQGTAGYMSWQQLRELHAAGVTIANHSASHDYLIRRRAGESETDWQQRVRADIAKGQRRLQEELGARVNEAPRLFAYPFGEYDAELAGIIRDMNYIALGQHSGAAGEHSDLQALPRFPVNVRYGELDGFAQKARSLPLPVTTARPWSPRVTGSQAPALTLMLGSSDAELDRLACYFEGREMSVERLSPAPRMFRVSTDAELPAGRSRYNCTAPQRQSGRWYWYSHLWVRQ